MIKNSNSSGVAMIMVLGTVAVLAYLLADFTFENNLHKIKIYNRQDQGQARLNAESGVNLAMAILKIYKTASNEIAKNETAKKMFPESKLNEILSIPFIFPIEEVKGLSPIQKTAIQELNEGNLLQGKLNVSIEIITSFLNPNILRIPRPTDEENSKNSDENRDNLTDEDGEEDEKNSPNLQIKKELIKLLSEIIKEKQENDEIFQAKFPDINPEKLIEELEYFVNDKGKTEGDYISEIQSLYTEKEITPKHGPLTSKSELYLLAGWDFEIVDLIKDRLTIHNSAIIPVNKINSKELKIIIPTIHDEEIEEFFKYRDGAEESDPHEFKGAEEFKTYIVSTLGVISEEDFEEREKELKKAGLVLGISSKTFKIVSIGAYKRARLSLTAFVILPIKPTPIKKKKNSSKNEDTDGKDPEKNSDEDQEDESEDDQEKDGKDEPPSPEQLLDPRVIEILVS